MDEIFNLFWDRYRVDEVRFPYRRAATFREWNKRSMVARAAMLDKVTKEGGPPKKNPFFYVQEFPEPQPEFLRGDESGHLVQVYYEERYRICTKETADMFGLKVTKDPW